MKEVLESGFFHKILRRRTRYDYIQRYASHIRNAGMLVSPHLSLEDNVASFENRNARNEWFDEWCDQKQEQRQNTKSHAQGIITPTSQKTLDRYRSLIYFVGDSCSNHMWVEIDFWFSGREHGPKKMDPILIKRSTKIKHNPRHTIGQYQDERAIVIDAQPLIKHSTSIMNDHNIMKMRSEVVFMTLEFWMACLVMLWFYNIARLMRRVGKRTTCGTLKILFSHD